MGGGLLLRGEEGKGRERGRKGKGTWNRNGWVEQEEGRRGGRGGKGIEGLPQGFSWGLCTAVNEGSGGARARRGLGLRLPGTSFLAHSKNELMQWRGDRRLSVRLSVCLSTFAQIASSRRQMAGSPPNLHKMDSRSACIQGVLKVKVKVKGHVIRALLCWHKNGFFSQANGLIATKLAHDGHQVSLHPGCSQGQG